MIKATARDIGRKVIYRPLFDKRGHYEEPGVITSISGAFVFVDYDGTGQGVGTLQECLTWEDGKGDGR